MAAWRVLRRLGRLLERVTDTWVVEALLGDPVSRPVELWRRSRRDPAQRRRVHLDANGDVVPDPAGRRDDGT